MSQPQLLPDEGAPGGPVRPPPAEAREPAAVALVKPRLRGVFHQYAFLVALVAGGWLVWAADGAREVFATSVYVVTVAGLFAVSALYHRVTWAPAPRRRMRRLDHAMIFLLIAGTYTPVGLLVLDGTLAKVVLVAIWAGAAAGIVLNLAWTDAPKWVSAVVYVTLGWVAVIAMPQMWHDLGAAWTLLVIAGGLVYSLGAAVYATHRPNPAPAVFGYHEIFHLMVIAGVALHFAAVAIAVLR